MRHHLTGNERLNRETFWRDLATVDLFMAELDAARLGFGERCGLEDRLVVKLMMEPAWKPGPRRPVDNVGGGLYSF